MTKKIKLFTLAVFLFTVALLTSCTAAPYIETSAAYTAQTAPPMRTVAVIPTPVPVTTPEPQDAAPYIKYVPAYEPSVEPLTVEHVYTPTRYTERDALILARMVWGEARGTTPDEQRLVVWTALQRVDADRWGNCIESVVTAHRQFHGYRSGNPICPYIYALVREELYKWQHGGEPPTLYPFAPTLPYYFFWGDGQHNWFREVWRQ